MIRGKCCHDAIDSEGYRHASIGKTTTSDRVWWNKIHQSEHEHEQYYTMSSWAAKLFLQRMRCRRNEGTGSAQLITCNDFRSTKGKLTGRSVLQIHERNDRNENSEIVRYSTTCQPTVAVTHWEKEARHQIHSEESMNRIMHAEESVNSAHEELCSRWGLCSTRLDRNYLQFQIPQWARVCDVPYMAWKCTISIECAQLFNCIALYRKITTP